MVYEHGKLWWMLSPGENFRLVHQSVENPTSIAIYKQIGRIRAKELINFVYEIFSSCS
jgi:hypothetical protein